MYKSFWLKKKENQAVNNRSLKLQNQFLFLSCGATSIYSLLCGGVCPTFLGLWLVENIIVIEVEVDELHEGKIL